MPTRSICWPAEPLSDCELRTHVPVRSTWADAGAGDSATTAISAAALSILHCALCIGSPPRRTGSRIPLAAVGFLLEYRRDQFDVREVLRIVDLRRDREPYLAIRPLVEIPV